MRPAISIIIPVYNAAKYIHRCIGSLLVQTFTDFELILINDGSVDNSGTICDEYADKDSRIKVIHKTNGGVASARQSGIDNATGTYTIHVDPDDWVECNMLEELYNKAIEEDADMVICDFYVSGKKDNTYRSQKISSSNSAKVLEDLLQLKLHGSLCNKLIKGSCYKDFNIRFIENLNYCEDYIICVKLLMNNIKVAYLDKAFYYYDLIVNDNSITRKYTTETYYQRCFFLKELKSLLQDKFPNGTLKCEANIAIECLRANVMTKKEFKKIYFKRSFKLLKYIDGYRLKFKFIKAILF